MLIWNFWPFPEGGAEKQCRLISSALCNKNISCSIITSRISNCWPDQESIEDLKIIRIGRNIEKWMGYHRRVNQIILNLNRNTSIYSRHITFWLGLPFILKARKDFIIDLLEKAEKNKWRFDIVHVFESSWLSGVGALLANIIGGKAISRCASWPAWQALPYDTPMRKLIARWRLKPFYTVMNRQMIKNLLENGITRSKCFLVPNGVQIPNNVAEVEKNSTVLYIGNFSQGSKWKGFDTLIKSWAKIIKEVPTACLVMIGCGDFTPWKKMAESLGCDKNIIWIGETRNTSFYYSKSGIFVLPSRVEGMSNALLEAQSWGIPCVVSNIPGNTSVVRHEKNGFVVPKDGIYELAESIIMLLKDTKLRKRLGNEARMQMEKRFALPLITEKWIQVYKTILQS